MTALSAEARAFLDAHEVGHLATADRAGTSHVVPLCYARLGDLLYFVADDKPKRRGPRALKRLANLADSAQPWYGRPTPIEPARLSSVHLDAAPVDDPRSMRCSTPRGVTRHRSMPPEQDTHPMIASYRGAGIRGAGG
jgi:hypothetical protein